ncbi:MAG TPA: class I SAM-dependent methyltransferase [Anaeromyxobacteraceae bacterium]|nr:class I SAM-dependent methyltransferase [Anaeromyxobacteraceae bacterium]
MRTAGTEYTDRLVKMQLPLWKRLLDVQRPYRWHLRRMRLGFTLDLGCGIGRTLVSLNGVGVDHNPESVALAKNRGCVALTPAEFEASDFNRPGRFDALLVAHVLEHLSRSDAVILLSKYLPVVRSGGRVVILVPQEAGYRSDPTHVTFFDFQAVEDLICELGLRLVDQHSFPFPLPAGKHFKYNESVSVARKHS